MNMTKPSYVPAYYRLPNSDKEYLCSTLKDNGLHRCQDLAPLRSTDLSIVCKNTLPVDWRPPKPSVTIKSQSSNSNDTWHEHRYEDRFVDGDLVPYDLVPGDEASPFLVKQLSPLIAQSVFQPAFAPRHLDSLPALRQKREALEQQADERARLSPSSMQPIDYIQPTDSGGGGGGGYAASREPGKLRLEASRPQSVGNNMARHVRFNDDDDDDEKDLHRHDLARKIKRARLAEAAEYSANSKPSAIRKNRQFVDNKATPQQTEHDKTTLLVETNANSDQFDSISQLELTKSDKSSRKYFQRKKANKGACINWNKYYTECKAGDNNPFQGTISFDNVGMAWTTIFLVISLEGWSDIMYLLQDSHSFWVWIYFVLLIVIGSFFMINLCLVVIATQFSATKKREMERMRQERAKFSSSSTLTAASESTNCYTVIVKTIARAMRRAKISFINSLKRRKCNRLHRQRLQERQKHLESHQVTGLHRQIDDSSEPKAHRRRHSKRAMPSKAAHHHHPHPHHHHNDESLPENQARPVTDTDTEGNGVFSATSEVVSMQAGEQQQQQEQQLSSDQMSAAIRRSSWKRASRSAHRKQENQTSDEQILAQASGDRLLDKQQALTSKSMRKELVDNEMMVERRQALKARDKQPSTRRSIRLGEAECGPSCRAALRSRSGSRTGRKSANSRKDALHSSCRHYHDCAMEDIEIAFCPKFITTNEKLQRFKVKFNRNIKNLVDHRYFQRLILLAILINTISMGIEYHNQPVQLTEAVEISNIVFACLFLIEMILKLIAHGVYAYVIDGFNCFDGCIVVLSILELFESSSGGSGLSVLRTFRLLRILKLVRFMPALRRQLVIMLRTLDNVAVFFALLVLFIFIFSILGMNLFGCKFCETLPDGTERCDRKNFNSLLWSLVTVFQILTQEDWNVSTKQTRFVAHKIDDKFEKIDMFLPNPFFLKKTFQLNRLCYSMEWRKHPIGLPYTLFS